MGVKKSRALSNTVVYIIMTIMALIKSKTSHSLKLSLSTPCSMPCAAA